MEFWRRREVQYATDCATCPKFDEALRQLLQKHGVHSISSSWVNTVNEETRKKARKAGEYDYVCVCGGSLPGPVHRPITGCMLHIALKQSPIYIF